MAFTNPKENLAALQLGDGMTVADLGSGTGNYIFLAAKEVGEGKVYAVDIQKELLERLRNEAEQRGIKNIEIVWADLEKEGGSTLKDNSIDALIVSNLLFMVEDKKLFLEEVKRILRPAGKVLVVDWAGSFQSLGPLADQVFPEDSARALFKENGFEIDRTLMNPGEHHYGFVARLKN